MRAFGNAVGNNEDVVNVWYRGRVVATSGTSSRLDDACMWGRQPGFPQPHPPPVLLLAHPPRAHVWVRLRLTHTHTPAHGAGEALFGVSCSGCVGLLSGKTWVQWMRYLASTSQCCSLPSPAAVVAGCCTWQLGIECHSDHHCHQSCVLFPWSSRVAVLFLLFTTAILRNTFMLLSQ
jgi:hypothetical protein